MSDIYQKIADHMLTSVDRDGKWTPPWHMRGLGMPSNGVTGHVYQGLNVLSCWASERRYNFSTGLWATYQQWQGVGAQVAKGMKGTPILFWKQQPKRDDPETTIWIARGYTVFNRDQVTGAPELPAVPVLDPNERITEVETFLSDVKQHAKVVERPQDAAYYDRSVDTVIVPTFEQFKSAEGYYATMLHELAHWTGHPDRNDRAYGKRFGDPDYALEELVAELSAAFLAAQLGIENEPRPDHAAYIGHWHRILKEDPAAFGHAVSLARKATTFLLDLKETEHEDQMADQERA